MPGIVDDVQDYVRASLAYRARWFINSSKVTDTELTFSATGKLGEETHTLFYFFERPLLAVSSQSGDKLPNDCL